VNISNPTRLPTQIHNPRDGKPFSDQSTRETNKTSGREEKEEGDLRVDAEFGEVELVAFT
jgi:hypothetical protein